MDNKFSLPGYLEVVRIWKVIITKIPSIKQNYASSGSGETTTAAGATSFYADPFADARGKWHSTSHVPDHGGRNSTVYRVRRKFT